MRIGDPAVFQIVLGVFCCEINYCRLSLYLYTITHKMRQCVRNCRLKGGGGGGCYTAEESSAVLP